MSELELTLAFQIKATKLPEPEREYRFHPLRQWRFDFAWPDQFVAVECEGGGWVNGRHNRSQGSQKDMQKYNSAALFGWRVLRYTKEMIEDGIALQDIERILTPSDDVTSGNSWPY